MCFEQNLYVIIFDRISVGKTANYAVVLAQLHTKGTNHGIHAFMVQLRDLKTHQPLPGLCVEQAVTFRADFNTCKRVKGSLLVTLDPNSVFIPTITDFCDSTVSESLGIIC